MEQTIFDSHNNETLYDTLALTRIKSDPNFFSDMLRNLAYERRLLGPCYTLMLTDDEPEMRTISLDQFNGVFSTPKPNMIINDPGCALKF